MLLRHRYGNAILFTGWYTEADGGDRKTRLFGMDFYEKNGEDYDWSHPKTITLYAGWVKD